MTFNEWCQESGYSDAEIGDIVGLSRSFVANLRAGRFSPSKETLHKLSTLSRGVLDASSFPATHHRKRALYKQRKPHGGC